MMINGLGFNGRSLHMYSQYFANKPLDKLIWEGIEPEHINDRVLDRTLDTLFELNVSKAYSELAIKVVKRLKLPCDSMHLDGTSLHVNDRYNSEMKDRGDVFNTVQLCRGYSQDHRPDLNQVILLLITENKAGIPLFMQAFEQWQKSAMKQFIIFSTRAPRRLNAWIEGLCSVYARYS